MIVQNLIFSNEHLLEKFKLRYSNAIVPVFSHSAPSVIRSEVVAAPVPAISEPVSSSDVGAGLNPEFTSALGEVYATSGVLQYHRAVPSVQASNGGNRNPNKRDYRDIDFDAINFDAIFSDEKIIAGLATDDSGFSFSQETNDGEGRDRKSKKLSTDVEIISASKLGDAVQNSGPKGKKIFFSKGF